MSKRSTNAAVRTVFVHRFPDGTQGRVIVLGTIKRLVRMRRLYVPDSRFGCASDRMSWRVLPIVRIEGTDYVIREAQEGNDAMSWPRVYLADTDAIPHYLQVGGAE